MQAEADRYILDYESVGDVIPSRAGLGCFIGVDRSTVYEWEKNHPIFSHTLRKIDIMQERTALNKGLDGTFNAAITKLILHNHGYSDRQATDHTSSDGSMTPKDNSTAVVAALERKHKDDA